MLLKLPEDLIISILQALFEFALEVFSYTPFDWPLSPRTKLEPETIIGRCFSWFVAGYLPVFHPGLLMLVFKHTFISHPALRIANLVLAPITSAFISQAIARYHLKRSTTSFHATIFGRRFGLRSELSQSGSHTQCGIKAESQSGICHDFLWLEFY